MNFQSEKITMAVNIRVKVHPVVLFQIADSYERRSQDNHRLVLVPLCAA